MDLRVKFDSPLGDTIALAALDDHVRRRVMFVLMHRRSRIEAVDVRLGPLRSKRLSSMPLGHGCRVEVTLIDGKRMAQFEIGNGEVFETVDRAVDLVGAAVEAHLQATADDTVMTVPA